MDTFIELLGFRILNITLDSVVRSWQDFRFVFPVNVDVLMKLHRDVAFAQAVRATGDSVKLVNDSQVLRIAARLILGERFVGRVSGSDLLPALCAPSAPAGVRVFLLGGVANTAPKAMECLNVAAGRHVVVGASSPSIGFEKRASECAALVDAVNASGATVLAVGVGAPKQELWMLRYASQMPRVRMFLAVGATLDFVAGNVDRAPQWVSSSALEWLYRLAREPRRLARRYLIDGPPVFSLLVKQRLRRRTWPVDDRAG